MIAHKSYLFKHLIWEGVALVGYDGTLNNTYRVVREDDTCHKWECIEGELLAYMHECWYCKYSDFRKDISKHRTLSVCRCPLNPSAEEEN